MPVNPSQIRLARLQRRCIAPDRPLLHSPASNAETPPSPGVIEHNCGLHENCARLPASLTCRKYTTPPGCFCNSGSSGRQYRGIPESMKPDNIFADIPDNPAQEILERLAGSGFRDVSIRPATAPRCALPYRRCGTYEESTAYPVRRSTGPLQCQPPLLPPRPAPYSCPTRSTWRIRQRGCRRSTGCARESSGSPGLRT